MLVDKMFKIAQLEDIFTFYYALGLYMYLSMHICIRCQSEHYGESKPQAGHMHRLKHEFCLFLSPFDN